MDALSAGVTKISKRKNLVAWIDQDIRIISAFGIFLIRVIRSIKHKDGDRHEGQQKEHPNELKHEV
jgi:hypothetical protein